MYSKYYGVKMKLWVGAEKEGNFKNFQTLFVGHPDITFKEIEDALSIYKGVTQIYFGAGRCSSINQRVLKKCIDVFKEQQITLEIDIIDLNQIHFGISEQVNFIVTFNHPNISLLKELDSDRIASDNQIKFQNVNGDNKVLYMVDLDVKDRQDISKLDGKIYKGDIVLR